MKNFPQIKTPEELGPLGESMMKLEEMLNKPVQQPVAVEKEPVQQPKTSDSIVKILEKAEHFLGTLYLWSKTKNIFLRVLFWFVAFLVFAEIFFSAINNGIGACEWFFSLSIWD